jgi:hypothetical protein
MARDAYISIIMKTSSDPSSPVEPEPPTIPYARTTIALDAGHYARIRRAVELLFRVAHSEPYRALVEPGGDPIQGHEPGNFGVMMGYDFHMTEAGPRLIEINTNAGGALLNGLRTAALCDPSQLAGTCSGLLSAKEMGASVVATFRAEFEAVRGSGAALRSVAIVDERPEQQFLFPEFELFRGLLEHSGIRAAIGDTGELRRDGAGGIELRGLPIDLVYLRDTDFALETPRAAPLREAYLAASVVVTPSPREHHLMADKRRLAILSAPESLDRLGVASTEADFLKEMVPETRLLGEMSFDEAWRTRRDWVFKPAARFGSRAVYRGDKISKRKLQQIHPEGHYVAQRRIEPGAVQVATEAGLQTMKFDVRAYAYRDQPLFLGARVYQGQVTNLRSPGGGFSAICVLSD